MRASHDRPVNEPLSRAGYVQKASIDGDLTRLLMAFPGYGRQPATTQEAAVRGSRAHTQWNQEMGVWLHPGVFADDRPFVFLSLRNGDVNLPAIGYYPTLAAGFGPIVAPPATAPPYAAYGPVRITWHHSGRAVAFWSTNDHDAADSGEIIAIYAWVPGVGFGDAYDSVQFADIVADFGITDAHPQGIDGLGRAFAFTPGPAGGRTLIVAGRKTVFVGLDDNIGAFAFPFSLATGVDWEAPEQLSSSGVDANVTALAWDPAGGLSGDTRRLAFGADSGMGMFAGFDWAHYVQFDEDTHEFDGTYQDLLPFEDTGPVTEMAFTNARTGTERYLAVGVAVEPYLYLFEWAGGLDPTEPLVLNDSLGGAVIDIDWHPDDVQFVVVSADTAKIWRIIAGPEAEIAQTLVFDSIERARAAAFSPDGTMLIVIGDDDDENAYAEMFEFAPSTGEWEHRHTSETFEQFVNWPADVAWKPPSS